MKLKKITLNNIRSYIDEEIEFPDGSILLSGDIGSGKTSILMAIEFALFGLQPGQRGNSLLKNGEKEGRVKIEIEVDDKEIIIERTLKKSKTVSQDYCSITINGDKKEISVTELKNRVLTILNYPSEFAKKQNMLYKFTVYTPQEEMKQIILQDPKTRINTLRHIFGIDKYKKILENTSIITAKIREEKRKKEGIIESLEDDKFNLIEKESDLEEKRGNLSSVEKELFLKTEERKKVQEEKEEINKKIEEKNKLQQEIEKTKIMVSNKKESINGNKKAIRQLREQIEELKKLQFDEMEIEKLNKEIAIFKKQLHFFNDDKIRISSEIASMNYKIKDNLSVEEKLKHIEVCPSCLQNVNEVYKNNVIKRLKENNESNNKKILSLTEEKNSIDIKQREIESSIIEREKRINELNLLKIKLESIEEKDKRVEEMDKTNNSLKKDIELLDGHNDSLKNAVFELKKYENIFEEKKLELENKLKEERIADIKVAELKKEIDVFSRTIEELKEKIKKTELVRKQMIYLNSLENWLSGNFSQLISYIEKNVMVKLKVEFSELFNDWFCMLVSDTFNVRLDDEFTPVIEQQDYEIDYSYLSGGERTAVALAYRLALNQEINSFLSKIKTKDIVILDEPTDGFSEQQLDKMRDVFQELNVKQLILVSHEQKIEGFVENVLKFKKENGITKLER